MTVTAAGKAVNLLGVHALVWVAGWSEPEARRAITRTREAGFDLIEVPLLDPRSVDVAMTRRLLDKSGVGATCSLGLPFDADVSSADPDVAARGEALLAEAVDVTAALGARFLGGVVHSAMGKHLEPPTQRGRRHAVDALRRVAERAARRDVTIGIEAVNRYESNLVNTAEQALALVDEVGAENVVVHLDSYHMNIEESDLGEPVYRCGARLGYVHVGESDRGYPGRGNVDFASLFRALAGIGYAGPIVFESFSSVVGYDTQPVRPGSLPWVTLFGSGTQLFGLLTGVTAASLEVTLPFDMSHEMSHGSKIRTCQQRPN